MLSGHGDDLYKYPSIRYNFSSNVYYKGCHPTLIDQLNSVLSKKINNYPSPSGEELNTSAAKHHKIPEENFLFFNGATEAFYTIAHAFTKKKAVIYGPTFTEYEDACKVHQLRVSQKKREAFNETINAIDIAFLCNPNNPDGSITSLADIKTFLHHNPTCTLVVDEAYINFTKSVNSAIGLIEQYPQLTIVRSLTKVYAIPGLRLGYVIAHPNIIRQLKACKMPWSINAMAIEAGLFIFKNKKQLRFSVNKLLQEMAFFLSELSTVNYLELVPTNTTYVLAYLKKGTASSLKDFLAIEHGLLIRDATNFRGLNDEVIRIALQSRKANTTLINAMKKW